MEKSAKLSGGIYHKIQIELTYHSNHIEGSRLDWFAVGDDKKIPNEVGRKDTTAPEEAAAAIKELLTSFMKDDIYDHFIL